MQYTTLRGFRLSAQEFGNPDGFPLVVLHDHRSSKAIAELFDGMAKAQGLRLISIDRPGYGQTTAPAEYRIEHFAFAVKSLLTEKRVGQFSVMGIGAGASAATELARVAASRVKSLHVFNPVMQGFSADRGRRLLNTVPLAFSLNANRRPLNRLELWLEAKLTGIHADKALQQLARRSAKADRAAMGSPVVRRILLRTLSEAFLQQGDSIVEEHRQAVAYRLQGSLTVPVSVYLSASADAEFESPPLQGSESASQHERALRVFPKARTMTFAGHGPLSVLIEAVEQLEKDIAEFTGGEAFDVV